VFRFSLLGLPKTLVLTNEILTPDDCTIYLENAITEIEMGTSMNLSPVDHYESFDYIDGMFTANFFGQKLERWPATKIVRLQLKYPHTSTMSVLPGEPNPPATPGTPRAYQTYTIPPGWILLRRNILNVVAAFGSIGVNTDSSSVATTGGIFSYITGFGRGAYQPGMIEIVYTAGFASDKLPSSVWDLIVTLASWRFLEAIAPTLMPYNSVNISIDGVTQSANMALGQLLLTRIQGLEKQYVSKLAAIRGNFGTNLRIAFMGA
jgi:hypothetical protein